MNTARYNTACHLFFQKGVEMAFNHSSNQTFKHSNIQTFKHSIILSFYHSINHSSNATILLSLLQKSA
ncbi:hypothetical protein ECB90_07600 [Helicobacter pylori]|nr:hypothetical protein ECB90_07600 [Helicobacter pylori]